MIGTHRILIGDCRETLKSIPDKSAQMICTSPPYWGLRSYHGNPGMIGLEATFAEHLANLMQVFAECWRVLRDDGVMFCNYGDAYNGNADSGGSGKQDTAHRLEGMPNKTSGLGPKNLLGMPWRIAFALQDAGWTLRQDIIWHKPNPMPESVTDRCTKAHEYLFLLSKRPRYFYDAEAIKEASTFPDDTRQPNGSLTPDQRPAQVHRMPPIGGVKHAANGENQTAVGNTPATRTTRNRRSVWTIPTAPFSDAHFATFPPALVEPCIKAGTSERGCCPACGAPWARVVERSRYEPNEQASVRTTGWTPTCDCPPAEPVPCVCLDPFGGSGTVAAVACPIGRNAIICEISPEYAAMAEDRIGRACRPNTHASKRATEDSPLFMA